jgi:hypothetical protein
LKLTTEAEIQCATENCTSGLLTRRNAPAIYFFIEEHSYPLESPSMEYAKFRILDQVQRWYSSNETSEDFKVWLNTPELSMGTILADSSSHRWKVYFHADTHSFQASIPFDEFTEIYTIQDISRMSHMAYWFQPRITSGEYPVRLSLSHSIKEKLFQHTHFWMYATDTLAIRGLLSLQSNLQE